MTVALGEKNSPIDIEYLNEISEGDQEFELELLQIYIEDTEIHLVAATKAIAAHDLYTLEREAHHMKGASGNVGALSVQNLAAQLEQQARDKLLDNANSIIEELENCLQQVKAFVNQSY